ENYPISGMRVHTALVESYVLLKKAAAESLMELEMLDAERGQAIVQAAGEVLAGALRDQFVVDAFHSGAGTSLHMNVNEVLAGRANEVLTGRRGGSSPVHPNDHVNMSQSTNDTFPTALRMAARIRVERLVRALRGLEDELARKGEEFGGIVKAGRTHLQDAVPVRLGQEFAAYAVAIRQARVAIVAAAHWLEELPIGGSAVGTGLNTHPQFRFKTIERIAAATGLDFRPAGDLRAGMQSNFGVALMSACLKVAVLEVSRIANDLRLLASGPATGISEIDLPAVQPGSSIMPGKVNPSIPEMTNMVCFQVIGNDAAVSWASAAGQLELNVMMPVMAHNLLQSIDILTNALDVLAARCVAGITARPERCRRFAESSVALATALNPRIGYDRAAAIVKEALTSGRTVVDVARERSGLSPEELDDLFDVFRMTEPRTT
ncbi:MAG: aspartate ammonia-lyase, partial [Acidobacteria bacterium]